MFNFVTITNKPYWTEIKEGTTVKDIKVNLQNEISFRKLVFMHNGRLQELPDNYAFTKYDIEYQMRQNGGARRIIQ